MLSIYELYHGWLTFWSVYFIGSSLFPSSKSVSRPSACISDKKLITNLATNVVATAFTIPIISFIPPLIDISTNHPLCYIMRYGSLFLISEIWLYYFHRLLHHKYFYRWHKDHHAFIHPHALAGLYCSPVEMIIVNQLSISIPLQILNYSYYEVIVFTALIAINVLKGHSGLRFYLTPNTLANKIILFLFDNKVHDLHHEFLNVNYGNFYILDYLHDTVKLNY